MNEKVVGSLVFQQEQQESKSSVSWQKFTKDIKLLAKKVDYLPDLIVGVARGGLVPAILISKELEVEQIQSLRVIKKDDGREITMGKSVDFSNKKVLVVDDMLETGNGFQKVKNYLEKRGAIVKTACLYVMPHTKFTPDFFLQSVTNVFEFPWD